jgi:hypothetical protein
MKPFVLFLSVSVLISVATTQFAYSQINSSILDATALANDTTPETLKIMGYESRIEPSVRADRLHEIALRLQALNQVDRDKLKKIQGAFQEALMQFTDLDVIITLDLRSVEEIDNALESIFTLDDIRNGYEWNSLAYVYGYFNHDVTLEEIKTVSNGWDELSDEEKAKQFPTYIHAIDAVVKPLAYWEQPSRREMINCLDAAVPLLNKILNQEPASGTAFHAPSHAMLILGDMYMRWEQGTKFWEGDSMYIARPTRYIGAKQAFGKLLNSMCIGSLENPDSLCKDEYRFYAVREYYIANTLARINWRFNGVSAEIMKKSLAIYEKQGGAEKTIHAIKRCMIALHDNETRETFAEKPMDHVEDFVWIIRNGKLEAVTYAETMLAHEIGCPVDKAMEFYYKQLISDVKRKMEKQEKEKE